MLSRRALLLVFTLFFFLCNAFAQGECEDGSVQECITEQECQGIQTCINGEWTECVVEHEVCEPGQTVSCIPIINGVECLEIEGLQQCNECGDFWLECTVPKAIGCCPGQSRVCDGNGRQECSEQGLWGYCFDGKSCSGIKCSDEETCTLDKCALGECVFLWIEKCCHEDNDCSSKAHCVEEECIELECGECLEAKKHECVPKKKGVCCNEHWNKGYSSCEFNYSITESRVESVDDERSNYFFEKGLDALDEGFLDLAKYSFMSAELAVSVFKLLEDYNSGVIALISESFASMDKALDEGNFKGVKKYMNETKDLLELKKPPEPKEEGKVEESGLPVEEIEQKPETPWIVIIILSFVLILLFILLLVEIKKRKITLAPAEGQEGMETE